MSFTTMDRCQSQCLTTCYKHFNLYRCRYNLTYSQLVFYLFYAAIMLVVIGGMIYAHHVYKLRQGFRKEKNGPCCFRYVRDEHRQEMRQVVYVEDGYGNLTEVGHDYVLVPQRTRQPELVPPPPAPIMADIQPPQEYQQPKVVPNTAPQF
ncbi:hypothetical protein SS50377_24783 [Spironucleus salmonicida]|uniref:Uncharacterized protein n=1 Tax=Spironucleus salmonicida TaxID=348837 RepID=V6LK57_9EUKA|nr:hypothetical protein SS50377_24783 [Spironucleus salmonicida]|eukprot:EST44121.1 Hypothetical protein SS50377_16079 [Spironucleus salmonicida]